MVRWADYPLQFVFQIILMTWMIYARLCSCCSENQFYDLSWNGLGIDNVHEQKKN